MTTSDEWMGAHGWRVLVQPNGLLAIFSMVTDEMLLVNATDEEVAACVVTAERERAERGATGLARQMVAEAREDSRAPWATRWERTLAMLGGWRGMAYVDHLTKRCA